MCLCDVSRTSSSVGARSPAARPMAGAPTAACGAFVQRSRNRLVAGGQPVFLNGVNLAWLRWGQDFIANDATSICGFEEALRFLVMHGGNAIRVWLFTEPNRMLERDDDGRSIAYVARPRRGLVDRNRPRRASAAGWRAGGRESERRGWQDRGGGSQKSQTCRRVRNSTFRSLISENGWKCSK